VLTVVGRLAGLSREDPHVDQQALAGRREELERERAHHLSFLDEHGADPYDEAVRDLQVSNDGFADSAQATEERSELLGQLDGSRQRIHLIDEALHRMDSGAYGTCVDCGATIPEARLEVRPHSVRCVACAEAQGE
jgi:DnaK suppressor protein